MDVNFIFTGKILAVGGLQEKLMAARRHGIKRIILPAENKPDVREMNKELLEGLELIFVKDYEQIYEMLFKGWTSNELRIRFKRDVLP